MKCRMLVGSGTPDLFSEREEGKLHRHNQSGAMAVILAEQQGKGRPAAGIEKVTMAM
jgi:hypothetical protein